MLKFSVKEPIHYASSLVARFWARDYVKGDSVNLKHRFKEFLIDESGQTTTEYILILAVIVTIFIQFKKRILSVIGKLFDKVDGQVDGINFEEGSG